MGMTRDILMASSAIVCVASAAPAEAQTKSFDIPAMTAQDAVRTLGHQADIQIIAARNVTQGKRTNAVHGDMTVDEALARLFAGTGLTAQKTGAQTYTVVATSASAELTRSAYDAVGSTGKGPSTAEAAGADEGGEILVTGSRIRGALTPSPVIVIGEKQIREEGFTDLGELIRNIPENFSGGQNPGVSSGNVSGAGLANQNVTGGSGLNLRGLGPDATLTLLNGRRLAYGGIAQSVDISAIPLEAVDRIEIVPDGASAIYGSDAVGGVGNVILKRDFEGLTIGGRIGGATDGGLATYEFSGTAGTRWSTGGFIAAYEHTSIDPIYARQRGYADFLIDPTTVYPGSTLQSGLISAHQRVSKTITIHMDAMRSQRDQHYNYYIGGMNRIRSKDTATFVAPGIDFSLPGDWTITLGGAWAKNDQIQHQTSTNLTSGQITVISNDCFCNESLAYDASAQGPLFVLPGGDARLAIGGGYRRNTFEQFQRATGTVEVNGRESAKFAYAELNLPLIGPKTNLAGIRRLVLTAAVRGEDYNSFGGIATPEAGLIYEPTADFTLKTSWGKSFKAPTLLQQFQTKYAYLYSPVPFGGSGYPANATVLVNYGGNPNLKPEKATTLSASIQFHPAHVPGLDVELTGFHIDYTDRAVQPITNSSQALSNPIYAQFIDNSPKPAEQAAVISSAAGFFNFAGAPYDPANVVGIINLQYLNAARQRIRGLDVTGSYRIDLKTSRITLRGSLSWLNSRQQVSSAQAPYDLAGTLFNPARFTGRGGVVWDAGDLSTAAFVNYKAGVRDTVRQEETDSFTTVDATVRYKTKENESALSGIIFSLSVNNLFDQSPPLYSPTTNAAYAVPYDSTNYSAIGRFVSFSISKHF
ncbi:TonB-dependent receptor [Hephaestia mangrovi]|uniref:TonB-dependent receptor n=1 Tax=Hephaestia mangrovi TaxID=2873268 RepID=UPI001CA72D0C|nr:TonB-dependent receptor [Hephaestia mangrovi]MBY8826597.1 TonB-dependent receptor [Hephaestia mangrovi]